MIPLLNIIGQITFFGFLLYFIISAWIDKGMGVGIVMAILGWVLYPIIARMFPLPSVNSRKSR